MVRSGSFLNVWPFVAMQTRLRMASADSRRSIVAPLGCDLLIERTGGSPGVRLATFAPYTRRIYARGFRVTADFGLPCPLIHPTIASYALRVPRAGVLPTASSPRSLTVPQLPFS